MLSSSVPNMANVKICTFSKIHAQHYFLEKIKSYLTAQFSLLIGMDEKRDWAAIIYGPIRTYRRKGAVPKAADGDDFMPDPDKEMAMLGETAKNMSVFNFPTNFNLTENIGHSTTSNFFLTDIYS